MLELDGERVLIDAFQKPCAEGAIHIKDRTTYPEGLLMAENLSVSSVCSVVHPGSLATPPTQNNTRTQMCRTWPKASSADSCMASLIVGCG
jgi:hypothetical protein